MGAKFDSKSSRTIVFSRNAPPPDAPSGVEFVSGAIGPFVSRLREQPGKDIWLWHGRPARESRARCACQIQTGPTIWLMGGGYLIASFLDEQAIDELVVSVVPVFIGDGIPLIARRPRTVALELQSSERCEDGLVQLHYRVHSQATGS